MTRRFTVTLYVTTEATDDELMDAARSAYAGHMALEDAPVPTVGWAVSDLMLERSPLLTLADQEMAKEAPASLPVTVVQTSEGLSFECPHCGAVGSICESDVAVRWNYLDELSETPRGLIVTWNTSGETDFEGDGHICTQCLTTALVMPDFAEQDYI